MKTILAALMGCLLAYLFLTPAFAAGPCQADIARFCAEVKPGGGRIVDCLKSHESALTPACYKRMANLTQNSELRQACRDDVAVICADVKPGQGRIIRCLEQHPGELSEECQEAIRNKTMK